MAVAAVPGFFIFRRPDKCACFAVLGRAAALSVWLVGGQATSGDTSGLSDMQGFLGYSPDTPANQTPDTPANRKVVHFVIAVVVLLLMALARQPFVSRYGELLVAVRDPEEQVRFFGHDPADVKLVAHVVAADMAAPSGVLLVPAVGIVGPVSGPRRTEAPLSSPASADAGHRFAVGIRPLMPEVQAGHEALPAPRRFHLGADLAGEAILSGRSENERE